MRSRLLTYLIVISVSLSVGFAHAKLAHGQESIVFGPETLTRGTGKPQRVVKNFSVSLPLQDFTISVQNGEGRFGRVSSAIVELNGVRVVGPNDFSKQVDLIAKPVSLQGQNSLAVELRSAPGTSVIVTINGQFPSVTETIPHTGGTVNLNRLASVTFPDGAFPSAQTVTVTATNAADIHEDFSVRAEGPRVPYEIRIKLGNVPPATSFDVILNVPHSFVASLPQDHQLEIFAQPIEFSETETLGHFKGYASTFDSATNTLRATLPPTGFNDDAPDDTFEAILIIAAIPKYQRRSVGTQSSFSGSSSRSARTDTVTVASLSLTGLLAATATPVCEGSPLGNPLERTPLLGSPFDPLRDHWGADYRGTTGENVHPVASGIVTEIGFDLRKLRKPNPRSGLDVRGWGRYVVITHEDGSQTLYAHLVPESTAHLSKGQRVSPSDIIAHLGSSGGAIWGCINNTT